jgi:serine O-acetyltransferase
MDKVDSHGNRVSAHPVIGDEVWIGPNAVIVGGVKVGRGSTIAGGAFVTMNIPPFSVVIGNPARVMMTTEHSDAPNPDSM